MKLEHVPRLRQELSGTRFGRKTLLLHTESSMASGSVGTQLTRLPKWFCPTFRPGSGQPGSLVSAGSNVIEFWVDLAIIVGQAEI